MHVLGLHVVFVVAVLPLLHVFFVCDPVSLLGLLIGVWVRGYLQEHEQLTNGNTTEENVSPSPISH